MDKDIDMLEEALGYFAQAMSRPKAWETVQQTAGVSIDRPCAQLLQILNVVGSSGCKLNELASRLGIEAPSVTRTVQQLELQKLVRRVAEPSDRRAVRIVITVRGQKIVERLRWAKREKLRVMLGGWSPHDRKQLVYLLHRLSHQAAKQPILSTKENSL